MAERQQGLEFQEESVAVKKKRVGEIPSSFFMFILYVQVLLHVHDVHKN